MLIQCTASLQAKIKKYVEIEDLADLRAEDANIGSIEDFFAWHANLHPFDQKHTMYTDSNTIPGFKAIRNSIILTHNVSNAPAVIIAARAATYKNFVNEVKHAIRTTMLAYGAAEAFVKQYLDAPIHFAKTGTRQQIGLHNEMAKTMQWVSPKHVHECRDNMNDLPRVMAMHMFDFILGGKDWHSPGNRMQEELMRLGGLSPQAEMLDARLKRERQDALEVHRYEAK